jgi:uncharacterized protein (DUF362 family)
MVATTSTKLLSSASQSTGSTVAVIKGHDLRAMTLDALDAIGGIESVINPGDSVFIKPNFVALEDRSKIRIGQCTKPEIVLTVAEECLKAGASKVVIGEGAQETLIRWDETFTLDGTTNLIGGVAQLNRLYGDKVLLRSLNASTPRWVFVPSRTEFRKLAVSSFATDADKVISIPVLKTHHSTAVTLSLKNFMGVTPIWLYGSPRLKLHGCDLGVEQCFLDVVKGIKPCLAIVDASIGAEGDAPAVGEGEGITVNVKERIGGWLVIAGTDLVAVDSTATRIIGHDPRYVKHLREAFVQGMGEIREERIEVVGESIANVRMDWLPSGKSGYPQKEWER